MWARLVRPRTAVLSLPLVPATAASWQGKHVGCEETRPLRPCHAVWSSALTESQASFGEAASCAIRNHVNSDAVLQDVRTDWDSIKSLPASFRDGRQVDVQAVCQRALAVESASERLCVDRDVVLDAVLQDVRTNWEAIKSLPASFRDDRQVVMEAVRQSGWALELASEALRADRDVVLEAVRTAGLALQFASEELRGDRDIVVEAVRQSGWALQYVADNLKNDCSLAAETTGFSSCSY